MKRRISKLKILYFISTFSLVALISVLLVSLFFKNNKVYAVDFEKNNSPYSSDQTTISSSTPASSNYISMTKAARGGSTNDYSSNVITIATPEELILFSDKCDPNNSSYNESFLKYNYKLLCSIDFDGITTSKFVPIGYKTAFSGKFDGGGYEISNLPFISLTTADQNTLKYWYSEDTGAGSDNGIKYFAMFSQNSGTIKNFGLISPQITISYVPKAESYIAPICGYNKGTISNVYHKMLESISENSTGIYSQGGFFISGFTSINGSSGKIENIYSAITIISQSVSSEVLTQAEILNTNEGSVTNAYYYDSTIISQSGNNTSGVNSNVTINFNPSYVDNDIMNTTSVGMYCQTLNTLSTNVKTNCSSYYYLTSYDESIRNYFTVDSEFYYKTPILRGLSSFESSTSTFTITNEEDFSYMYELFSVNKNFATAKFTYNITSDIDMSKMAAPTYSSNIGATVTSTNTSNIKIYNAPINDYHATNLGFDAYGVFPWVTGNISNIDVILGTDSSAYEISFASSSNRKVVGALVGYLDGGSISNVNVYLNVTISSDDYYLGGIVGMIGSSSNVTSSVKNSTVNGSITETTPNVTDISTNTNYLNSNVLGGAVGYIDYTTGSIDTVLSTTSITLVGSTSSYALGGVLGAGYANTLLKVQYGNYTDSTLNGSIILGTSSSAMSYDTLYVSGVVGRLLGITNQVDSVTNYGSIDLYEGTNPTYISGIMNVDIIKNATSYLPKSSNPLNNKGEYLFYASALSNDSNIKVSNTNSSTYYTYGLNINSSNGFTSKIGGLYNLKKKNKDDIEIDMSSTYSFASLINNKSSDDTVDVITAYNFKDIKFATSSEITKSTTLKYSGIALGGYATLSDVHNVGDLTFTPTSAITSNIIAVGIIDEISSDNIINSIYNGGDITLDSNIIITGDIYFSGITYENKHEYTSSVLNTYNPSNANFDSTLTGSINNTINAGVIKVTNSSYADITYTLSARYSANNQSVIGTSYSISEPSGYVKGNILLSGIVSKNESVITNTFNLGNVTGVNYCSSGNKIYSSGISTLNISNSSYILNSANNGTIKSLNISNETTAKVFSSGISCRNDITSSGSTISGTSGHSSQIISFTINYGSIISYNYAENIQSAAVEPRTNSSGILSFGLCNIINVVNYGNIYSSETTSGIFGVVYFINYIDDVKTSKVNIANSINYGNIYVLDKGNNLYNSTDSYLMPYSTFLSIDDSNINSQDSITVSNVPVSTSWNESSMIHTDTYETKTISPIYARTSISTTEGTNYFLGSIFSLVNFNGSEYANNVNIRYLISFNEDIKLVGSESNTPSSVTCDISKIYSSYYAYVDGSDTFSTYMGKNVVYAPLSDSSSYALNGSTYTGIFSSSFPFRLAINGDTNYIDVVNYATDAFLSNYFEFVSYSYVNSSLMEKIGWKTLVYIDAANSFASSLEGVYKFYTKYQSASTSTSTQYQTDITNAFKTSTWSSYASKDVLIELVGKLISSNDLDATKTLISYIFSSSNDNSALITNTIRSNILEYIISQDKFSDILNEDILGFSDYFSKTLADYLCDGSDNEIEDLVSTAIDNYLSSTSTVTKKELLLAYVDYLKSNGDAFFEYTTKTSKYELVTAIFDSVTDDTFYTTLLSLFSSDNQTIINNVSSFDSTLKEYGGYQSLTSDEKISLFKALFTNNDESKISTYLSSFASEIGLLEELNNNGFEISSFDDVITSVTSSGTSVSSSTIDSRVALWNQIRGTTTFSNYLSNKLGTATLYFKATESNNTYQSNTTPNDSGSKSVNMAYAYTTEITPSTYFYGPYSDSNGTLLTMSSRGSSLSGDGSTSYTTADINAYSSTGSSTQNRYFDMFMTTDSNIINNYSSKLTSYDTFIYEYGTGSSSNQFVSIGSGVSALSKWPQSGTESKFNDSSFSTHSNLSGTALSDGYININGTVVSLAGGRVSAVYYESGTISSTSTTTGYYLLYDANDNEYIINDSSYYLCDESGTQIETATTIKAWYKIVTEYSVKYYIGITNSSYSSYLYNTSSTSSISGLLLSWSTGTGSGSWIVGSKTSQYIKYSYSDLLKLDGYLTSYSDGTTLSEDERSIISSLFDTYFLSDTSFSNIVKKALFESAVDTTGTDTTFIDSMFMSNINSSTTITSGTSSYKPLDYLYYDSSTTVSSYLESKYTGSTSVSTKEKIITAATSNISVFSELMDILFDVEKTYVGTNDGIGYGGTLNFLEILERMEQITNATWSYPSVTFNGYGSSSSSTVNKSGNNYSYMPLSISNEITSTYYTTTTSETISKNNIGYFTASESKIANRNVSAVTSSSVIPVYGYNITSNSMEIIATGSLNQSLDKDVYDTLYNTLLKYSSNRIYGVRFNKQIDSNNWIEIDDTTIVGLTNQKITIPMNTVWFAAQGSGSAKIVYCGEGNNKLTRGVGLYYITRTTTDDSKYKYYSDLTNKKSGSGSENTYGLANYIGGVSNVTSTFISSAYKNTLSDGSITYTYNAADSNATSYECVYSYDWYTINSGATDQNYLHYLEIPLIEGYEYAFGQNNDGEGMIIYMDIGQNAVSENNYYSTVQNAIANLEDNTITKLLKYLIALQGRNDDKYKEIKAMLKVATSYDANATYYTRSGSGTSEDPYIYKVVTDVTLSTDFTNNTYYVSSFSKVSSYIPGVIYYTRSSSGTSYTYTADTSVTSSTDFSANEYYAKSEFINLSTYLSNIDMYVLGSTTSGTSTVNTYTKTSFGGITDYSSAYVMTFAKVTSGMSYNSSRTYYSYSNGVYTVVSSPSTTSLTNYYISSSMSLSDYLDNLRFYTYDESIGYTMVSGTNYSNYYILSSTQTIKDFQDLLFTDDFYKSLVTNSNESMSNLLAYVATLNDTTVVDLNNIIDKMISESSYIFDSIVSYYSSDTSKNTTEFKQYLTSAYVATDYILNSSDLTNTILYERLQSLDEQYQYITSSTTIDNDKFEAFAKYIGYDLNFNFGIYALASSSGIKDGTFIPDNLVLSSMDPYYNSSYDITSSTDSSWRGGSEVTEGSINYAFSNDMKQLKKSISTTIIEIELTDSSNNIYYASSEQITDEYINIYYTGSVPSSLTISSLTYANKATSSMSVGGSVSDGSTITITAEDTTVSKTYTFKFISLSATITSFTYDDNTNNKEIESSGDDIVINLVSDIPSNIDLKPYITISSSSNSYNYLDDTFSNYFSYYTLGNYQITTDGKATIKFKVLANLPGGDYTIKLNIGGAASSLTLKKTLSSSADIEVLEFDNVVLTRSSDAYTSSILFGRAFSESDLAVTSGDNTTIPGYLSDFSISTNATYSLSYSTSLTNGLLSYVLTYTITAEDMTIKTYTHTLTEVSPYNVGDTFATIYKDGNTDSSVVLKSANEYSSDSINLSSNITANGYVYATSDDMIDISFRRNEGAPTYRVYFNLSNFYTIGSVFINNETTSLDYKGLSSIEDSYAGLTLTVTENCDTGVYTFEYIYYSTTLGSTYRVYKFPIISITKSASTDSLINNITFLDNLSSIGASATKINPNYAFVVNNTSDNNSEYDTLGTNELYYADYQNSKVGINSSGDLTYTTNYDLANMNYYILGSVSDATLSDYAPTMKINEYSEIYQYTTLSKLTTYGSSQNASDSSILSTKGSDILYLYVPCYIGDSEEAATSTRVFLMKMEVSATGVKNITAVYNTNYTGSEDAVATVSTTLANIHNLSFSYEGSTYKVSSVAGQTGNTSLNMDYIGDPKDGHFWYVSYVVFSEAYIKDSSVTNANFYHISIVDLTNNVYFTISVNVPEAFVTKASAIYLTISYVTYDGETATTSSLSVYAIAPSDANSDGTYTFKTQYSLSMLPSGYYKFYLELPHGYTVTYSAYRNSKEIDNNLSGSTYESDNEGSFVPPSSIVPQQIDLVFSVVAAELADTSTWGAGTESTTTQTASFSKSSN